jgi:ferredoxin-NADP reductase
VAVKLTAEDGYSAQRDYSIASAPGAGRLELTVQRLADGEVSPYLTEVMVPGDQVEVRGPIGGWFTWDPAAPAPLQLIAGGSGIVPLMSMIRAASGDAPIRLLYSARTPADLIYADELAKRHVSSSLTVTYLFTRLPGGPASAAIPGDAKAWPGRISRAVVDAVTWGPEARPAIFVCGPSGFVSAASDLLLAAGHAPATIKTERFGPTG